MAKTGPKTKHKADKVDVELLTKLAAMQCTMDEIAAVIGCSIDTLERNFAGTIKEGRSKGTSSVKRKLFEKAQNGDLGAIIWFSKNFMGMSDRQEVKQEINSKGFVIEYTTEKKDSSA